MGAANLHFISLESREIRLISRGRKRTRVIIILSCVFISLVLVMIGIVPIYSSRSLRDYESRRVRYRFSAEVMPEISTLPESLKIEYRYRFFLLFPWASESMLLVVTYDRDTFEKELARIEREYDFLDAPAFWMGGPAIPQYEFTINSFTFRVLANMRYPKDFGIIAYSDDRNSIAYLYFFGPDLDVIYCMVRFINRYFLYVW